MAGFPSYPRLSGIDLASEPHAVAHIVSIDKAAERVSLHTHGAEFYPTAVEKVNTEQLTDFRDRVLAVARRHQFPQPHSVDAETGLTFDQALAIELHDSSDMSPYEASQRAAWAFLACRVVPDVVLWRYPASQGVDHVTPSNRVDGFKEDRRGILRQAWWRGYILGPDLVKAIHREDDYVQLTDRTGITRNPQIARVIAGQHVVRLADASYARSREQFQSAIKRISRLAGRLSLEALPISIVERLVSLEFDYATGTITDVARPERAESIAAELPPAAIDDPIGVFLGALPPEIRSVAQAQIDALDAVERDATEAMSYRARVHARHLGTRMAARIAEDLNSLVNLWQYLRPAEQEVVYVALQYFLDTDDLKPDDSPGGLEDDDLVVSAAFTALSRPRRGR